MTAREIEYDFLGKAVQAAFEGDTAINCFYDPNIKINGLSDIVNDICSKSKTYDAFDGSMKYYEIIIKDKPVGYFFFKPNLLISFGLNVAYRKKPYLKMFFKYIKKELGIGFYCVLWNRNQRAIRWLCKMGMKVEVDNYLHEGNLLSKLKY